MRILARMHYTNPFADPASNEYKFGWAFDPTLRERYGLEQLHTYFFQGTGTGYEYDQEHMEDTLQKFPKKSFVMLNLEGESWQTYDARNLPKTETINARRAVLQRANEIRRDCQFAFFTDPPAADYERVQHKPDLWHALLAAQRELIEMQDCLVPHFYPRRTVYDGSWQNPVELTPYRAEAWVSTVIDTLCREFPRKPVWPIVWPVAGEWWQDHGDVMMGDVTGWTARHRIESRVDGCVWQAMIDAIQQRCDTLLLWGQGHCPWDSQAEWFKTTLGTEPSEQP